MDIKQARKLAGLSEKRLLTEYDWGADEVETLYQGIKRLVKEKYALPEADAFLRDVLHIIQNEIGVNQ